MPQKVLRFTGINRKVNEFKGSGTCEELINLRPDGSGGFSVVKKKHIEHESVQYERLYSHSFGSTNNRIAVSSDGSVNWINTETGGVQNITRKPSSSNLIISFAGKVMLIYDEDSKENMAFKFEDDTYKAFQATVPSIRAWIDYRSEGDTNLASSTGYAEGPSDAISADSFDEALQKAVSTFYEVNKNGLCGAAMVGCTCELEDGSEVWSTAFVVANNAKYNGRYPEYGWEAGSKVYEATVFGTKMTRFCLDAGEMPSGIKMFNVYASRPVFRYRYVQDADEQTKQLPLKDLNLDGQLMYYQGSIDADNISSGLVLDFSAAMSAGDMMDVNAGCIERTGPAISYNNRFHFYRSEVQHRIQKPTLSSVYGGDSEASQWIAYVNFDGKWKLIDDVYSFSESKSIDVVYPMSNIKEIVFVKGNNDGYSFDNIVRVQLNNSTAYNYSYAFDVTPKLESGSSFRDEIEEAGQLWSDSFVHDKMVFQRDEINAINVTVPYNPFAFSINASYSVGGEIKDIATSYIPVSSTQIGQYPLTVFTTNGIFALEQGSGNVLYSNITPLSPYVITGKSTGRSIATPHGTFFICNGGVYLLSGREAVNLSNILIGERELNLRDLDSYKKLCCSKSSLLVDFSQLLSGEDFEDFISDATLTYDQFQNELYISSNSPTIPYSYVLNIDTSAYHKTSKKYIGSQNGERYAIEVIGDTRNVVDMHVEESAEQPILLQSRPMSLEVLYTHIQRLMLLVDTKLTGEQNICFSVFGSDNLYDWKCIISSQKQKAVLRQIRTNRAAKSYKDYIILINGLVSTDTDLSDIIVDYTIVNRRLG